MPNKSSNYRNGVRLDVPFVSQLNKVHADLACGVASLAMLLKEYGIPCNYEKLCKELRITEYPCQKGFAWEIEGSEKLGPGAYFQDIVGWLQEKKVPFYAANIRTKYNFENIERLITKEERPVMVGVDWYKCGHWIVLSGWRKTNEKLIYYYLDPGKPEPPKRGIGKDKLYNKWDGTFIALKKT